MSLTFKKYQTIILSSKEIGEEISKLPFGQAAMIFNALGDECFKQTSSHSGMFRTMADCLSPLGEWFFRSVTDEINKKNK